MGTGYSQEILHMLGKKLRALETKKCPFSNYDGTIKNVHWVKPKLVAEFQFAQWTNLGRLRVGRYKGLRTIKRQKMWLKKCQKNCRAFQNRSLYLFSLLFVFKDISNFLQHFKLRLPKDFFINLQETALQFLNCLNNQKNHKGDN